MPSVPEFRQPIFKLSPARMELKPGESVWMTVEGKVTEPGEVRERLLCHSIIGRQGGKEQIMMVDLYVEFISPLLEFSQKSVFFRFDKVSISSAGRSHFISLLWCVSRAVSNYSFLVNDTDIVMFF